MPETVKGPGLGGTSRLDKADMRTRKMNLGKNRHEKTNMRSCSAACKLVRLKLVGLEWTAIENESQI